jgi:hypothetical protein
MGCMQEKSCLHTLKFFRNGDVMTEDGCKSLQKIFQVFVNFTEILLADTY